MSNEFIKRLISSIILIPLVFFFIIKGALLFNLFIFVCFLIICYEWHSMAKSKLYYLFGFFFIIFSFYSIYKIRNFFPGEYNYFLLILLICIFTDIGGYIFGKIFNGPKLTKFSPKKTYSGMLGAYFLSILIVLILLNEKVFFLNQENSFFHNLTFILIVSTISQCGDILISYFKRLSKIKDTGKIIPGHGGLLDRADGMIFAFPLSYIILSTNLFL